MKSNFLWTFYYKKYIKWIKKEQYTLYKVPFLINQPVKDSTV